MHFSSIQFSHSVMSDSSDPMDCSTPDFPVHHQLPELAQTHGRRVSDAIQPSHSLYPLLLHLQSFPASGSFQMSQLFASGGQNTGLSASASVLPMNTHDGSPLEWTGWIFLQSKGLSKVFSNTTVQKHQFFCTQQKWDVGLPNLGNGYKVREKISSSRLRISILHWEDITCLFNCFVTWTNILNLEDYNEDDNQNPLLYYSLNVFFLSG